MSAETDKYAGETLIPPPIVYIVVPCYNEEQVLPLTVPKFSACIRSLALNDTISSQSRICFIDDGSTDDTWKIIEDAHERDPGICGISLSRNRGHQSALLCGLLECSRFCDAVISMDCDGQDDIGVVGEMVEKYLDGDDVVYGVRSSRSSDTAFKRFTAESFYRLLSKMGVETVFNHADFRLMSRRALEGLSQFGEVNLFLRGIVPLIGFPHSTVEYERNSREAGDSHYPLQKMAGLAIDAITSLSIKPIHIIAALGAVFGLLGLLGMIWAVVAFFMGSTIPGWSSTMFLLSLLGGLQLCAIGIVGEYVGKIYLEAKRRPRYIIQNRIGI